MSVNTTEDLAKWCEIQSDMIQTLQDNIFNLIHLNVPILEKYQQQASILSVKETEKALVISKFKLLIENIGIKKFEAILYLLKNKQYDRCQKTLEKYNIFYNEIDDFLHILKEYVNQKKIIL